MSKVESNAAEIVVTIVAIIVVFLNIIIWEITK